MHISNVLVNLSAFCFPQTEASLPPQPAPTHKRNSCRHLTTESLRSKETFTPKHFLSKRYFSVTFDPSPTTVKREQGEERNSCPNFSTWGCSSSGREKERRPSWRRLPWELQTSNGFLGSSSFQTPVEEEVGRERVGAGIADDQLSEPKDVLSPGLILVPLLASSAWVRATPFAAGLEPQSRQEPQPLSFLC